MNECLISVIPDENEIFNSFNLRLTQTTHAIASTSPVQKPLQNEMYNNYLHCAGQLVNEMLQWTMVIYLKREENTRKFIRANEFKINPCGKQIYRVYLSKSFHFCFVTFQCKFSELLMPFCDKRNKAMLKQILRFPTQICHTHFLSPIFTFLIFKCRTKIELFQLTESTTTANRLISTKSKIQKSG